MTQNPAIGSRAVFLTALVIICLGLFLLLMYYMPNEASQVDTEMSMESGTYYIQHFDEIGYGSRMDVKMEFNQTFNGSRLISLYFLDDSNYDDFMEHFDKANRTNITDSLDTVEFDHHKNIRNDASYDFELNADGDSHMIVLNQGDPQSFSLEIDSFDNYEFGVCFMVSAVFILIGLLVGRAAMDLEE